MDYIQSRGITRPTIPFLVAANKAFLRTKASQYQRQHQYKFKLTKCTQFKESKTNETLMNIFGLICYFLDFARRLNGLHPVAIRRRNFQLNKRCSKDHHHHYDYQCKGLTSVKWEKIRTNSIKSDQFEEDQAQSDGKWLNWSLQESSHLRLTITDLDLAVERLDLALDLTLGPKIPHKLHTDQV